MKKINNNFNNKKIKLYKLIPYMIVLLVLFLSIGYSTFSSNLNISGIAINVRPRVDIRITNAVLNSFTNKVTTSYTDYNINSISTKVNLLETSSMVTYQVEVTNIGSTEMGIYKITGLPENLEYELNDYVLKDALCDNKNNCSLGIKKVFYITIKYKANGYDSTNTDYAFVLNFDFRKMYNVTYDGIVNNNYQTKIISGDTLDVTFTNSIPPKVVPYVNGEKVEYTYKNNKVVVPNVENNITLKYKEKVYLTTLSSGAYFKESAYLTKIKTVQFVDTIDTIGVKNAIASYDLSKEKDKSIIGWIDSNYNLYIASEWNIYAESLSSAFYEMSGVTSITFDNLNTSETTSFSHMFGGAASLVSLDLSTFDTSKVNTMQGTFFRNSSLTSLDLSNFNTSNVTNMMSMFNQCTNLTSLDVSNFDTSKVTRMDYMFYNMAKLTYLDISNFDTSNVTNMMYLFSYTPKIQQLILGELDTSNVTNMSYMFHGMIGLSTLDVSSFDTSKVTNMANMFYNIKVSELDLSSFDTSKVTNMNNMFQYSNKLKQILVSDKWVVGASTTTTNMFADCGVSSVTLK